ncbi:MAG: hypothetical protein ACAH12_01555 [Methylophilaceae bacterium]
MKRILFSLLIATSTPAIAGGPIAPKGWDGSFEKTLPNGQPCCIPADLNDSGLTGGAIVLVSSTKHDFGVFALTYTPKEKWQLLEKHPISQLTNYHISIEPPGRFPMEAIKVCSSYTKCAFYYTSTANPSFKRDWLKPAP